MITYYRDTYSPTHHLDTLRFTFAFCSYMYELHYTLTSIGFLLAFLNAVSDENIYMYPPVGMQLPKGTCWKVLKAMYGTTRGPRLWHTTLETFLVSIGYRRSISDPCLFYRADKKHLELIFFHIDDLIICSTKSRAARIADQLKKQFEIHEMGFPDEILGIQVSSDITGITLSAEESIGCILKEFEMDTAAGLSTPLPPNIKLPSLLKVPDPVVIDKYRRLLDKLLYVSKCVRLDISYAVNLMAGYCSSNNKTIWKY